MSHKLRHVVRWACLVSAIGATGIGVLSGCSDDDDAGGGGTADAGNDARSDTGTQPGTDSGNPGTDSGQQQTDSGHDSGNQPTVTVTTGPSGLIQFADAYATGFFYVDDTIIHASDAPDCVVYLRSGAKTLSVAGDLTITSDTVGQAEGPTAPAVATPDPADNSYIAAPDQGAFFATPGNGESVQVQLAGNAFFPALPPTTLHAPVLATLTVTAPVPNTEAGAPTYGKIDTATPLVVTWAVADAGPAAGQRVLFHAYNFSSAKFGGSLDCSWPMSAGTGTVPVSLLSAVKAKVGTDTLSGNIQIETGDYKEVVVGGASYTILVSRFLSDNPSFQLK